MVPYSNLYLSSSFSIQKSSQNFRQSTCSRPQADPCIAGEVMEQLCLTPTMLKSSSSSSAWSNAYWYPFQVPLYAVKMDPKFSNATKYLTQVRSLRPEYSLEGS